MACIYSVVTPLGEGPDEPGHAGYVFFLAREGRLPDQRANEVPGEGHQPPLAYALAAPLVAWLPTEQRRFDLPGNPRFTWNGGSEPNAAAHGSRELWPWRGEVLAWHLARLMSVACGALAVVFTYLAGRSVKRRWTMDNGRWARGYSPEASFIVHGQSSLALLAAALVAFNPQFLYTAGLVTNDTLLAALSAAMLWLVVRAGLAQSRPKAHALALGVLLGLALITKQSALLLAPIAFLSVLGRSWRAAQARGTIKTRFLPSGHLGILSNIALLALTTLLICGWWYLRNWRLYGDPFGLAAFQAEFAGQAFDIRSAGAWIDALKQLHSSFWARFGWMNVRPPGWVIWFFTAVEAVAIVGLMLRWRMGDGRRTMDSPVAIRGMTNFSKQHLALSSIVDRLSSMTGSWALLALPLLAFAWIVSFALTAGLVAWQGRLLFPALPAIAILLAAGMQNVKVKMHKALPYRRVAHFAFYLLPFTLAAIALWLPFGVIRPAYPTQVLSEQAALERLGTPADSRLGKPGDPGAELRGWRLAGGARPGAALELTLTWHARGRQNRDWTVFVHLVDARETIVAEDNRQPRDGAFPMGQWVAGDWVEDTHPLVLPADLPAGAYSLRVGLWDPATDERAAVYNQKNKLIGDYVSLGSVTIPAE